MLLEAMNGDEEATDEISTEFLNEVPLKIAALLLALAEGNGESAAVYVHALKGIAGNVGGEAMESAAAKLDRALKAGDTSGASEFARLLEREFERLKEAMIRRLRRTGA